MDVSVRVIGGRLGSREPAEVHVELISNVPCHLKVKAKPRRDDQVRSGATVQANRHAVGDQVHEDCLTFGDVAYDCRDVGDRHIVGVGNVSTGLGRGIAFLGHLGSYAAGLSDRSSNLRVGENG